MKRAIMLVATIVAAAGVAAVRAEPSESCDRGFLPTSATPAGAGLRVDTEPGKATVTACNTGAVAPAPGHARVVLDGGSRSVLAVVDGDPESAVLACSDGYAAARAGVEGVGLYQSGDGGYTSRARPKSPQDFAGDVAAGCAPGATAAAEPTSRGRR